MNHNCSMFSTFVRAFSTVITQTSLQKSCYSQNVLTRNKTQHTLRHLLEFPNPFSPSTFICTTLQAFLLSSTVTRRQQQLSINSFLPLTNVFTHLKCPIYCLGWFLLVFCYDYLFALLLFHAVFPSTFPSHNHSLSLYHLDWKASQTSTTIVSSFSSCFSPFDKHIASSCLFFPQISSIVVVNIKREEERFYQTCLAIQSICDAHTDC